MGRYLGGLELSWAPCFLGPRCPGLTQNSLHQGVQRLGGSISYTHPVCTTLSAFDRWWSFKKNHHLRRGFLLILQSFSPGCEVLSFLRTNLWLLKQRSSKDICCCLVPSRVQLFSTPWAAVCHVSSSFTIAQSLLKLMSIESVMPSNHLILCHPLLLPSILPSIRVFSNESVLCMSWPKYWSFSFSISPSNEYSGLISFRIDWFYLLAVQGTLKSLLQYHSLKGLRISRGKMRFLDSNPPNHTHTHTHTHTQQPPWSSWNSQRSLCFFTLILNPGTDSAFSNGRDKSICVPALNWREAEVD